MSHVLDPDPADGVFGTMLVVDGRAMELDAHLARLRASIRELYALELPPTAAPMVAKHARDVPLGRLRLSVTPVAGGDEPLLEVVVRPIEPAIVLPDRAGALDLRAVTVEGWDGAHKWADRRLLEQLDAQVAPAGALLVDPLRGVLETTRANVFALGADGVLRTPPADGSILPGIARGLAIELAREAGAEVREEPLSLARLADAAEAFATGSVRGLEAIRTLDGAPLAAGGELSPLLVAGLRRRWFAVGAPAAAPEPAQRG